MKRKAWSHTGLWLLLVSHDCMNNVLDSFYTFTLNSNTSIQKCMFLPKYILHLLLLHNTTKFLLVIKTKNRQRLFLKDIFVFIMVKICNKHLSNFSCHKLNCNELDAQLLDQWTLRFSYMFLEICKMTPLSIISSLGDDGQIRKPSISHSGKCNGDKKWAKKGTEKEIHLRFLLSWTVFSRPRPSLVAYGFLILLFRLHFISFGWASKALQ